jgi:hypothetical protein
MAIMPVSRSPGPRCPPPARPPLNGGQTRSGAGSSGRSEAYFTARSGGGDRTALSGQKRTSAHAEACPLRVRRGHLGTVRR